MAKASVKLPDGTLVTIEGSTEEVGKLLNYYSDSAGGPSRRLPSRREAKKKANKTSGTKQEAATLDLSDVVNLVKNCEEAEAIEAQILDRTSQVDRTLLSLYMVYEHLDNEFALTSGDVSQVTTDLGIPISQPNASRTLSGIASRYVIGDKVRKKGQPVRYKLSRRGVQYLKSVLQGGKREG